MVTIHNIIKTIQSLKPLNIKDTDKISIKRIKNNYGTNRNVFKVVINNHSKYFLKISNQYITKDKQKISNYLNTPTLYFQKSVPLGLIEIFEYIEGSLLTDLLLQSDNKSDKYLKILELEKKKNKNLLSMYSKTLKMIPYQDIMNSKGNHLFYKRLTENRFKEYYYNTNLEKLFDKVLIINGFQHPSIKKIIDDIKDKYESIDTSFSVKTVYGHGDIHHQNIIVEKNTSELFFIDNEYNSQIPINMEIAKPYYIDLLGSYFFFFNEALLKMISVDNYQIYKDSIDIKLSTNFTPKLRLGITQNKIETFKNILNVCNDPISVNDYLVMSHILSRDPNSYDKRVIPLFLAYIPILSSFNILKPEELFIF
ncbi:MAG: hypothetical protein PHP08_04200 [Candidatus Dojkabacteria bacterium]|nr:hypothetical protein [Candidatus Dojkabacteria bacterium]